MNISKDKTFGMISLVTLSCIFMAIIETIIEPAYVVKSAMKVLLFLFVQAVFLKLNKERVFDNFLMPNKKIVIKLFALGTAIYVIIMGAYILTKNFFDYSSLVNSLSTDQKVTANKFIWVASYISFGNSFLEEFLFRFFAFIILSKYTTKTTAYIFSSVIFAVYHIAIIGPSFPLPLLLLSLIGLTVGGSIFNYVDSRNKNIYNSWIIHMFADFAIMTIWYIHI